MTMTEADDTRPDGPRGSGSPCPTWHSWFETTPVPVWVEDFSRVGGRFRELRASGVPDIGAWLAENPGELRAMAALVRVTDANQAAADFLRAGSREELLGDLTSGFDDESYGSFLEELRLIAAGERRFNVDVLSHGFDGARRHIRMQWTAAAGHEEDLSVVFLTGLDITAIVETESRLRSALEAKDFFLREIQHRVRNTLTLIDSIISMQARVAPDSGAMLDSLSRRVDTLAVVHDSLYNRLDPSLADLKDCVEGAARQAFHHEGGRARAELSLGVAELDLPIELATPMAMIAGELTANAIRHGAAAGDRAVVRVDAWPEPDGRVVLRVRDGGTGPAAADGGARGLGLRLVEALASQLRATLDSERAGDGYSVTVSFKPRFGGA